MRTSLRAAVALALVLGCKRGAEEEARCAERMDALGPRLVEAAARPLHGFPVPEGIQPIESKAGRPADGIGPIATVGQDGTLSFQGRPAASAEELARLVAEERARFEEVRAAGILAEESSPALSVWLDRRAPAAALSEVREALPPSMTLEVLAVEAGWKDPSEGWPAATRFRQEVGGQNPAEKAAFVAAEIEGLVSKCAPMVALFGEVAMAEDKAMLIATELPGRARQCRCQLGDLDRFEAVMLGTLGAFDRPVRAIASSEWESSQR